MTVTIYPSDHGSETVPEQMLCRTPDDLLKKLPVAEFQEVGGQIFQSCFHEGFPHFPQRDVIVLEERDIVPSRRGNGFVDCLLDCYNGHHDLILRPDDVWTAIASQFSYFVNATSNIGSDNVVHLVSNLEMGEKMVDYSQQIENAEALTQSTPEFQEWIKPKFEGSTTTNDEIVYSVLMLATSSASMSEPTPFRCGLPSVTLQGKLEHWQLIEQKVDEIRLFCGKHKEAMAWRELLLPIARGFVQSYWEPESLATLHFWRTIVNDVENGSSADTIGGWLSAFCYFDRHGQPNISAAKASELPPVSLFGLSYPRIPLSNISGAFVSHPATLERNGQKYNAKLLAGSVAKEVIKINGKKTGYAPLNACPINGSPLKLAAAAATQRRATSATEEAASQTLMVLLLSRAGPRFVCHYPPQPNPCPSSSSRRNSRARSVSKDGDGDSLSSSDGDSSSEEEERGLHASKNLSQRSSTSENRRSGGAWTDKDGLRSSSGKFGSSASLQQHRRSFNSEPDDISSEANGENAPASWESLFGLRTYVWEKLLCAAESFRKRKFEVGINDLAFVGWPVFVKPDGTWKTAKSRKKKHREPSDSQTEGHPSTRVSGLAEELQHAMKDTKEKTASSGKDDMAMFNVVFVLNPPALEYNLRLKDQYDNVVKKFNKGLKAEQARAGYVWEEVQIIMNIKDRARHSRCSIHELYAELHAKSSLVRAIATIYENISQSRIASVKLTPETTMSLQIPPIISTPDLPSATEPAYPGLWLTSVETLGGRGASMSDPEGMDRPAMLAKHFALLLLVDEKQILKDIDMTTTFGLRLAHYIRVTKPNKSFVQISAISGIPLSDIQVFAGHLIYWRRARAIPPLNQQDTYIVSPNADLRQLHSASAAYKTAFPAMPTLPKMLAMLSGPPRPYSTLIPSRDHKDIYYSVLVWLLRGGWVTQLRTLLWVKVSPEIKAAASMTLNQGKKAKRKEAEEEKKGKAILEKLPENSESEAAHTVTHDSRSGSDDEIAKSMSPIVTDEYQSEYEEDSVHSEYFRQEGGRPHGSLDVNYLTSSLILKPYRASPLESRWLEEIQSRFPPIRQQPNRSHPLFCHHLQTNNPSIDHPYSSSPRVRMGTSPSAALQSGRTSGTATPAYDTEGLGGLGIEYDEDILQRYWPIFTKYFNGSDSAESIAVREGMKKKVVRRLLTKMDEGILKDPDIFCATEPRQGVIEREKVLLKVRHW
ncbi:Nitrogen permease regulator 3 [Ascosphaera aggregata]|nr:Nitrogen permease regulator 3 [Ascosphaera aggregata]